MDNRVKHQLFWIEGGQEFYYNPSNGAVSCSDGEQEELSGDPKTYFEVLLEHAGQKIKYSSLYRQAHPKSLKGDTDVSATVRDAIYRIRKSLKAIGMSKAVAKDILKCRDGTACLRKPNTGSTATDAAKQGTVPVLLATPPRRDANVTGSLSRDGYQAFISYARQDDSALGDGSAVLALYNQLIEAIGADNVFLDRKQMPARPLRFTADIADAIRQSDHFVVFIGEKWPATAYAAEELQYALESGCVIHPVLYHSKLPDPQAFDLIPSSLEGCRIFDLRELEDPANQREIDRLIQDIKEPAPPKARLFGVPACNPKTHVPRVAQHAELLAALRHVDTPNNRAVVYGMPGAGKSVLAASLCREASVRREYPDGIFWLSVSQTGTAEDAWRQLAGYIPTLRRDVMEDEMEQILHDELVDRCCLLVFDDIWSSTTCAPILRALDGTDNFALGTSRNASIARKWAAFSIGLGEMAPAEALQLLTLHAGRRKASLPDAAQSLARALGYLPLSLSIAGAMVKEGHSWEYITGLYERKRQEFLSRNPLGEDDERQSSAFAAMQMSVDDLEAPLLKRYLELAVFPKGKDVPITALQVLWNGLDPIELEDTLLALRDRSLLSFDDIRRVCRLHDLQSDYLSLRTQDITSLHRKFVEAYRPFAEGGWWRGPDDGYFHQHIIDHLLAASLEHAQEALACLRDYRWMKAKLSSCGIAALQDDYSKQALALDPGLSTIREFLRVSAHVLAKDWRQLPSQIHGRLPQGAVASMDRLAEQAKAFTDWPWLRPEVPCMLPPESGCLATFHVGEWIAGMAIFGHRLVVCDIEGVIRQWDLNDLQAKDPTRTSQNGCKITCVASVDDLLATADEHGIIRWWDPAELEILSQAAVGGKVLALRSEGSTLHALWEAGDGSYCISRYGSKGVDPDSFPLPIEREWVESFEVFPKGSMVFHSRIFEHGFGTMWIDSHGSFESVEHQEFWCTQTTLRIGEYAYTADWNGNIAAISSDTFARKRLPSCQEGVQSMGVWQGTLLVGGKRGGLWRLDGEDALEKVIDIGARVDAIAEYGKYLITADYAGKVSIWDDRILGGKQDLRIREMYRCAAYDGNLILSTRDGQILEFDGMPQNEPKVLLRIDADTLPTIAAMTLITSEHPVAVAGALVAHEGNLLFSCGEYVFRLEGEHAELVLTAPHNIRNIAYHDGFLYIVDKRGGLTRFDSKGWEEPVYGEGHEITDVKEAFGKLAVSDDLGVIRLEDASGHIEKMFTQDRWIRALATKDDYLASGDWFGVIRVFHRITGSCLYTYYADSAVNSLAFVGERLYAVTKDGSLHMLAFEE